MKKFFTAFLLLLCLASRAATVNFCLTNFDATLATNSFIVSRITERDFYGNYGVIGLPSRFAPTNGCASKVLLKGDYELKIYGEVWRTNMVFSVPDDDSTYDLQLLWTSGGNVYNYSPGLSQLIAGQNITLSPTNGKGVVTVTSSGGGGVSIAAGTGISAVTNGSLVTIAELFIPQFGSLNLTNFSTLTTNFFYPSNNPAGFAPSNSIASFFGYVTNAVTTNTSTGVTNVVNNIFSKNSIGNLSDVKLGTPGNGNILTYQNGWTNLAPASTSLGVIAGTNVNVVTNGGGSFTVSAVPSQTNISIFGVTNANNLTNWTGVSTGSVAYISGQNNFSGSNQFNGLTTFASTLTQTGGGIGAVLQGALKFSSLGGNIADANSVQRIGIQKTGGTTIYGTNGIAAFSVNQDGVVNIVAPGTAASVVNVGLDSSGNIVTNALSVSSIASSSGFATNLTVYANGQAALTEYGGSLSTNALTGNWSRRTNGIITLGPTNAAAKITLDGSSGSATVSTLTAANGMTVNGSSVIHSSLNVDGGGSYALVVTNRTYLGTQSPGLSANVLEVWTMESNVMALAIGRNAKSTFSNDVSIASGKFIGDGSGLTNLVTAAQTNISAAAVTNAGNLIWSNAVSVVLSTNGSATNTTSKGTLTADTVSSTNFVGNGGNITNIAAASVGTGNPGNTNFLRGDRAWTNRLEGSLIVAGGQTNTTVAANFSAGLVVSNNATFGGSLAVSTNISIASQTANRLLITDNSSPPNITNVANGGVNTLLHGTTPPAYSAVAEGDFSFTDVTTANASTAKHGLAPKYPNDATKFLDGTGNYSIPSATSSDSWKTNGNSGLPLGSFIGTTDQKALQLKANGQNAVLFDNLFTASSDGNITFGNLTGHQIITNGSTLGNLIIGGLYTAGNYITNGVGHTLIGGAANRIGSGAAQYAAIIGGSANFVNQIDGVIIGGTANSITGTQNGIVLGGNNNQITAGNDSIVGGQRAIAAHGDAFVWSDSSASTFTSMAANTFNIRASAGEYHNSGSLMIASNSLANWPTAPKVRGDVAFVNSNGYPYILLSTNGIIGSATWTATNKIGW